MITHLPNLSNLQATISIFTCKLTDMEVTIIVERLYWS